MNFQAVLVTDGYLSVAMFQYDETGLMNTGSFSQSVVRGFDAGDGLWGATYTQFSGSMDSFIFRIDGI